LGNKVNPKSSPEIHSPSSQPSLPHDPSPPLILMADVELFVVVDKATAQSGR